MPDSTKRYRQQKRSPKIATERQDSLRSIPNGTGICEEANSRARVASVHSLHMVIDEHQSHAPDGAVGRSHHERRGIGLNKDESGSNPFIAAIAPRRH
jgi:hypothetical protein